MGGAEGENEITAAWTPGVPPRSADFRDLHAGRESGRKIGQ
jgi:hypothetical protein